MLSHQQRDIHEGYSHTPDHCQGAGGCVGVQVLKDAPGPGTGTAHSVAKLASYLQAMMGEDTDLAYTKLTYGRSSNSGLSEEECMPRARTCKKSQHSKVVRWPRKNRRWTRMMSQRRIHAPPARISIARSSIKLNQTSACGTKSTRATASNWSATSLKWHSIHAKNFLPS